MICFESQDIFFMLLHIAVVELLTAGAPRRHAVPSVDADMA